MPVHTYMLGPENPKRLEIVVGSFWRGATVRLDGQEIGTVPGKRELLRGQDFKLPDGSTLNVRLIQHLMGSELHILRDGRPIPGSASHPETAVRTAYWLLFLIAAVDIVFGVAARTMHVDMLAGLGISDFSIGFGVILAILGYLVRRGSLPALYAGIAVYAADTALGLVLTAMSGGVPDMFNIILRGLMFVPLIQGVGGLRALKQAERNSG